MFDLLFYCHIVLFWEKVTYYEKFTHNLTFEVQIIWKISALQHYCWEYRNTEKKLSFEKFQLIWKIVKHFMRSKQWASSENYSASPNPAHHQIKSYYVFVTNIFLGRFTEIYRHLLSKCFKKVVLGRQEMVQCKCFFLHQTETFLLENLYTENFFWLCFGSILFSISKELRIAKWVMFFWSKLYCKMSDLFH